MIINKRPDIEGMKKTSEDPFLHDPVIVDLCQYILELERVALDLAGAIEAGTELIKDRAKTEGLDVLHSALERHEVFLRPIEALNWLKEEVIK